MQVAVTVLSILNKINHTVYQSCTTFIAKHSLYDNFIMSKQHWTWKISENPFSLAENCVCYFTWILSQCSTQNSAIWHWLYPGIQRREYKLEKSSSLI